MRKFNADVTRRIWIAKTQAKMLPEPDRWLAEITQIERSAANDSSSAAQLVLLLREYLAEEAEADRAAVTAIVAGQQPRRRSDLYAELVRVVQLALLELGYSATEALTDAYAASEPGSADRTWILLTLAELGDPALEGFFKRLEDDSTEGPLAKRGLTVIQQKREGAQVQHGGGSPLSEASSFDEIVAALANHSYMERWRAAEALGEFGDRRAIEPLKELLNDSDENVRRAAREALDRLGA